MRISGAEFAMPKRMLRLLRYISESGELTIAEAIQRLPKLTGNHEDVYPLALLVEGDYVGITVNYQPPDGGDSMREFGLAYFLHMLVLPKDADGDVKYRGVTSLGSMRAEGVHVFIKAKGANYLAEIAEKRRDRIVFFILGLVGALAAVAVKEFLPDLFGLEINP